MKRTSNRRLFLKVGGAMAIASRVGRADESAIVADVQGPVSQAERASIVGLGQRFVSQYGLPGVSLAIGYRGQLKLVACFGDADRARPLPVSRKSAFRIASVSKPITSVTILRLQEQGKLSLDARVFARGGQLARFADSVRVAKQRAWLEQITIRHLLEHSCGGWSNQRGVAPMFAREALGMAHPELIQWTIKNRPLTHAPGTHYAYSNFGYCLLGRVIEAVTGLRYQRAVKQLVLEPVGATATHVAKPNRERHPHEVIYYDKHDPYGTNMDVARMDAHGGWVSTPIDLVRFAQGVDGIPTPPDVLRPETINTMTTARLDHYALGWNVNASNNWWHTGSFNGGSSILARIHDGHCWAVLVNTRSYVDGYYAALDQFPWQVMQSVKAWGSDDLFHS